MSLFARLLTASVVACLSGSALAGNLSLLFANGILYLKSVG